MPPSAARTSSACPAGSVAEVGLGEHDQRLGLRVGGEREEALQPAHVEVAVQRSDRRARGRRSRRAPAARRGRRRRRGRSRPGAAAARARRRTPGRRRPSRRRRAGRRRSAAAWVRAARTATPDSAPAAASSSSRAAVHGGDAGGDQVGAPERREGGVEARGPAEGGEGAARISRGQREISMCEGCGERAGGARTGGHGRRLSGGRLAAGAAEPRARRRCGTSGSRGLRGPRVQARAARRRVRLSRRTCSRVASESQRPSSPTVPGDRVGLGGVGLARVV